MKLRTRRALRKLGFLVVSVVLLGVAVCFAVLSLGGLIQSASKGDMVMMFFAAMLGYTAFGLAWVSNVMFDEAVLTC